LKFVSMFTQNGETVQNSGANGEIAAVRKSL
jgi:hypothetical protein